MGLTSKLFLGKEDFAEALRRPSAWVLICVNLGLIAGVIVWDWQVFDIVFLYWVENLVIGGINVLKMAVANPDDESLTTLAESTKPGTGPDSDKKTRSSISKAALARAGGVFKTTFIVFFIIHYGMFCYGHGVFVISMFGDGSLASGDSVRTDMLNGTMLFAIGLLAASHLFSFFRNFIAGGEYRRTHPTTLMTRPYGRIVALHITIILGAFLTMAFDSPLGLLVILIVLKTLVDLAMHESERNKFQGLY